MGLTRPKYSQIYDTDYKQSVRLATTADLGNLAVILSTGMPNSVDGVSLAANDRILVKDQATSSQNGIYRVVTVGTGANGAWLRALDADASDKVTFGLTTSVSEGTVNSGKTYKLTTADPITLGTTGLTFTNPYATSGAAGLNTQVQFNDSSVVAGSAGFTFTKASNAVVIAGNVTVGNLIAPTGIGQFSGPFNESSTTAGIFLGNAGTGTPSPRIGFFNANSSQNWQIDNYFGQFRWFTPGVTQMTITSPGVLGITTVNASGNVLSTGAIHNSLTVNGATTQAGTLTVSSGFINSVGNIISTGAVHNSLTINGTTTTQGVVPSASNTYTVGSTTAWYSTVYAKAMLAQYADLAETYASDSDYIPGTVVVFGGEKEVTISTESHNPAVAGVVSTNPAYHMNAQAAGVAVALQGRVPCRVRGPINKGDRVVASDIPGIAQKLDMLQYQPGCIIGKSLEKITDDGIQTIEVVVGRN